MLTSPNMVKFHDTVRDSLAEPMNFNMMALPGRVFRNSPIRYEFKNQMEDFITQAHTQIWDPVWIQAEWQVRNNIWKSRPDAIL